MLKNKYGIQIKPRTEPAYPIQRAVSHSEFLSTVKRVIQTHAAAIKALASK